MEPAYHDAWQFYWYRVDSFLSKKSLEELVKIPFILKETEVQDIDNEEDWKLAEMKFKLAKIKV